MVATIAIVTTAAVVLFMDWDRGSVVSRLDAGADDVAGPATTLDSNLNETNVPDPESRSSLRWTKVAEHCYEVTDDKRATPLAEACIAALDGWFLGREISPMVIPAEKPLLWSDVFEGIDQKIDRVRSAIADDGCAVPRHEIRRDLAKRCGAREMVELQVAVDACSHVEDDGTYVTTVGVDETTIRRRGLDHYVTKVWPEHLQDAVELFADEALDQTSYWKVRRRLDVNVHRTVWVLEKCFTLQEGVATHEWLKSSELPPLMTLAARYGEEFALATYPDTRATDPKDRIYLEGLLDTNPLLALVRSAEWYPAWIQHLWDDEQLRDSEELDPIFLDLVGLDPENSYSYDQIQEAVDRRAEFMSLMYRLAAEYLAEHLRVDIDAELLETRGRMDGRRGLPVNELSLAQYEAEELASKYMVVDD